MSVEYQKSAYAVASVQRMAEQRYKRETKASNVDPSLVFSRVSGDFPWSERFDTSSEDGSLMIVMFCFVFESFLGKP